MVSQSSARLSVILADSLLYLIGAEAFAVFASIIFKCMCSHNRGTLILSFGSIWLG